MKVHFLKSATTLIESRGVKILTDPWLVDGEYYGSWFHYPPFDFRSREFDDVDFIYISHIHPDHFSRRTLQELNKDIPVLIHNYKAKFLKRNIESLGFQVTELAHNQRTHLKNQVHINILAADNCDPELCGKFFGCGNFESDFGSSQIDSLTVIDDESYRLLNLNDCPFQLAKSCAPAIKETYKQIDFMLVGYAGAGPFPQCFTNLSQVQRKEAANKKQKQFLDSGAEYINLFQPKYFMPFAGTYTLGGKLAKLNDDRGVPEIEVALDYFQENSDSQGVLLNSGEHFELQTHSPSKSFTPSDPEQKQKYIDEVLAQKVFDFEHDEFPTPEELTTLLPAAYENMNSVRQSIGFSTETKVVVSLSRELSAILSMNSQSTNGQGWEIIANEKLPRDNFVRFTVDSRLLLRLLKGPRFAHWNNAEIGSHITYERKPETFERGLYYCMNFFCSGEVKRAKVEKSLVRLANGSGSLT